MTMTTEQLEGDLGASVRALRASAGLTRAQLARRANVSEGAVKNLELGYGANVTTLVRVVHALGADEWLTALTPLPQFDPFAVFEHAAAERAGASGTRGRRHQRAEP